MRWDASAWPQGQAPAVETQHPGVCFDPADPLFAQMGEDARTATAARGEEAVSRLVEELGARINGHLDRTRICTDEHGLHDPNSSGWDRPRDGDSSELP